MYYILYLGVGCILCIGLCDYCTGMWPSIWDCICSSTVTNTCNSVDDICICACVGTNLVQVLLCSLWASIQPPGYIQSPGYISVFRLQPYGFTFLLVDEPNAHRFIANSVRA